MKVFIKKIISISAVLGIAALILPLFVTNENMHAEEEKNL